MDARQRQGSTLRTHAYLQQRRQYVEIRLEHFPCDGEEVPPGAVGEVLCGELRLPRQALHPRGVPPGRRAAGVVVAVAVVLVPPAAGAVGGGVGGRRVLAVAGAARRQDHLTHALPRALQQRLQVHQRHLCVAFRDGEHVAVVHEMVPSDGLAQGGGQRGGPQQREVDVVLRLRVGLAGASLGGRKQVARVVRQLVAERVEDHGDLVRQQAHKRALVWCGVGNGWGGCGQGNGTGSNGLYAWVLSPCPWPAKTLRRRPAAAPTTTTTTTMTAARGRVWPRGGRRAPARPLG